MRVLWELYRIEWVLTGAVDIDKHGNREEGGDKGRGSDKDGGSGNDFGPGIHDEDSRDYIHPFDEVGHKTSKSSSQTYRRTKCSDHG